MSRVEGSGWGVFGGDGLRMGRGVGGGLRMLRGVGGGGEGGGKKWTVRCLAERGRKIVSRGVVMRVGGWWGVSGGVRRLGGVSLGEGRGMR